MELDFERTAQPIYSTPPLGLAVKIELLSLKQLRGGEPGGSRVKACLELARNEKVLITTLMPTCQSPAGLSMPPGRVATQRSENEDPKTSPASCSKLVKKKTFICPNIVQRGNQS